VPMASADLDPLAAHVRGLARLAGDLLRDPSAGDDIAQEAVLRTLRSDRTPADASERRRWLWRIGRRLVWSEWLRRARRSDHESAAARLAPGPAPSSAEIAERTELAAQLNARIRALPADLGTVLLDRYVGGLSPSRIAERDGLSVHTVKARLRRAKRALRADLERRGLGGADHWSASLPLLAAAVSGRGASDVTDGVFARCLPLIGAASMSKLAAATVLILGAALLTIRLVMPEGVRTASDAHGVEPQRASRDEVSGDAAVLESSPSPTGRSATESDAKDPGGSASDAASAAIDPTWAEAKAAMEREFEMQPTFVEMLQKRIFRLRRQASPVLRRHVDLSSPAEVDWSEALVLDDDAELPEAQLQAISDAARRVHGDLERMQAPLEEEFGAALHEYWEHDMGLRYRASQPRPEGQAMQFRSTFNVAFGALHGDWILRVRFDAADFPALETALEEPERRKAVFLDEVEAIVGR